MISSVSLVSDIIMLVDCRYGNIILLFICENKCYVTSMYILIAIIVLGVDCI